MVSSQASLCSLILVVCALLPVTDAEDQVVCMNMEYSGPVKEVIEAKATKLAEDEAGSKGRQFALDLIEYGIGKIPHVGEALDFFFGQIKDSLSGDSGELSAEDVYNSLKEEIKQLRQYMDEEIVELKIDQIKKIFGTKAECSAMSNTAEIPTKMTQTT